MTVYCLPCVWASDNDADGLPQMLMENMASGLPAISTRLVGIPDLIIDGQTGLLVEPNNAEQLADAIERLAFDRKLAQRLAKAGRKHIIEHFELESALQPLIGLYHRQLDLAGFQRVAVGDDSSNTTQDEGHFTLGAKR